MGRPEDNSSASSPLSCSPDQSPTRRSKFNFDALVSELGEFGPFQRWLYFFMWFPAAAMAIGVYAFIFMEYVPDFQCFDAKCSTFINGTDQCSQPVFAADCTPDLAIEPIACKNFWYDADIFTRTVISEFNAVCSDAYLRKMSTSIYMSGMLFGSFFFGWFSDRFGRRICFAFTVLFLAGGSLMAAFALNYPMYIASRFITSMGGMGIFITAFVISMEFIGPKYRTSCGIGIEIPFALGELYLGLMAYLIRDWRHLQLAIGIPFFGFFFYLIKLPESVRWAVASGRTDVAMKSIRRLADFNNRKLPADLCLNQEDDFDKKRMSSSALFTSPSLRNRFIIMAINWVVATLCYYGLGMSASLIGDVFTTFSISASMEIPSYIFCMLVVDRWGRKPILSFVQILAALACITAGFLPEDQYEARLCFVLIGKFGASASFAIVFLYTAELFPTPLRNTAVGLCSTFARLGAILAPTVADLGNIQLQLPFLVMGGSTLVGGLAALSLPETAGKQLPDTLEEALSMSQETILVEVEDELLEKGEKCVAP